MPCASRSRAAVRTAASTSAPPTKRRASEVRAANARMARPAPGLRARAMAVFWKRLMGSPFKESHYAAPASSRLERE